MDERTPIDERFAEATRRHGPLGVDVLMELALYDDEHGFYAVSEGAAGRRGADFLTSPEVGPLFGAVIANALDAWWDELERPDPFHVIEAGAGAGMLARTVLAARPRCLPALTYVLVERSRRLRSRHGEHLALDVAAVGSPPHGPHDEDGEPSVVAGSGPRFVSASTLPRGPLVGVVLANELLDNLPAQIMERAERGWVELRLSADDAGGLEVFTVPVPPTVGDTLGALAPEAPPGAAVPWQSAAMAWLKDASGLLERGRVVVIDYGRDTPRLAEVGPQGWLRTYRDHAHGDDPFVLLGTQDVTVDVAWDQMERTMGPAQRSTQRAFLERHGIEDLVAEGRRIWQERAHLGDLEAVRARSRVREAEALCDPDGLGGFDVLEWVID